MPRWYTAAAKPATSVTMPPPTATTTSLRVRPHRAQARHRSSTVTSVLWTSPSPITKSAGRSRSRRLTPIRSWVTTAARLARRRDQRASSLTAPAPMTTGYDRSPSSTSTTTVSTTPEATGPAESACHRATPGRIRAATHRAQRNMAASESPSSSASASVAIDNGGIDTEVGRRQLAEAFGVVAALADQRGPPHDGIGLGDLVVVALDGGDQRLGETPAATHPGADLGMGPSERVGLGGGERHVTTVAGGAAARHRADGARPGRAGPCPATAPP